ncbi:hypothetical protein [Zavarzinia sp. CC-PAN008]|uniref:hypothetical protein n=1 Tax=Zavarzinia sp. CC-PAN008 TaxID=3243332 RepID=UPI003F74466D
MEPKGRKAGPASAAAIGAAILAAAESRLDQAYVLGADVPLDDKNWDGPWDCAEFASWAAFQATGRLYGCVSNDVAVRRAEPYSGGWWADVRKGRPGLRRISIEEAMETPGAFLVRAPREGRMGHVAISNGKGGTVEAHSTSTGTIRHQVAGRRWDGACVLEPVAAEAVAA